MISYIENEIYINHPIVFLCGPYYIQHNKEDRRNIMLNYFDTAFNKRLIPLIIDDFMTNENIKDSSINIKLMEEIFASISSKTYIFLDTMSAASELGLFAHHSTKNNIHVLLPNQNDIIDKRVGYFVSDVVLKQNQDRIEVDYYRPKIVKRALATNFVVEHLGFINDKLPNEIAEKIKQDRDLEPIKIENPIKEDLIKDISGKDNEFHFVVDLSLKQLFYMTASFVYKSYTKNELKDKDMDKISDEYISEVYDNLRKCIVLSYSLKCVEEIYDFNKISIKTNVHYAIKDLIKHILKFIYLYHESEPRNGRLFINKQDKVIKIDERDLGSNPFNYFNFTKNDIELVKKVNQCPQNYFEEFTMVKYRKKRELCKYKNDLNGEVIKTLHTKLLNKINEDICFSDYSYAYQKKKSIVSCVQLHLNSKFFMKLDIKNFFNSIDISLLTKDLLNLLNIDMIYAEHLKLVLNACTYNDRLPLGFSISPILTEVYLKEFDEIVKDRLNEFNVIYTRYADDIMISSDELLEEESNKVYSIIDQLLRERKLILNKKKFRVTKLISEGQHVKYLGINIIKGKSNNYISVGKKYKYDIAKNYLKYMEMETNTEENKQQKFYTSKRIAGMLSFVEQVEGKDGYWDVVSRLKYSTEGRVHFITDKIVFESI